MQTIERIPQIPALAQRRWQSYLVDTLLAVVGALLVTMVIYVPHLYPTIPNISIVYLLVILVLASVRGRYAALVGALVACLSFDLFSRSPVVYIHHRTRRGMAGALCLPGGSPARQPAGDGDA